MLLLWSLGPWQNLGDLKFSALLQMLNSAAEFSKEASHVVKHCYRL